jgi:hypothetical protein
MLKQRIASAAGPGRAALRPVLASNASPCFIARPACAVGVPLTGPCLDGGGGCHEVG